MPGSLPQADTWLLRARTAEAMLLLVLARLALACLPLKRWSTSLGLAGDRPTGPLGEAVRLANHVERAGLRLPLETKCLPRAMALSWMLKRRSLPHSLTIAARPRAARGGADDLHAWIEVDGRVVLGELPGPWLTVLTLP